jgi:hypothetical protein
MQIFQGANLVANNGGDPEYHIHLGFQPPKFHDRATLSLFEQHLELLL